MRRENELTRNGAGLALTTLFDRNKVLRPPPRFSERSNVAPSLFAFRGDQIREIERGERITTAKMGKLFGRGRFGSKREKSDRGRSNRIGEISPGNHASASNRSYRLDSLMPRRARATTVRPSISRFFTKTARGMPRSKERRSCSLFGFGCPGPKLKKAPKRRARRLANPSICTVHFVLTSPLL